MRRSIASLLSTLLLSQALAAPALGAPEPGEIAEEKELLAAATDAAASVDAEAFARLYGVQFHDGLGYDPLTAARLDLIQGSDLALDADSLAALGRRGFTMSDDAGFYSFLEGAEALYRADLPLYVSADMLLHALHRSYSDVLKAIEEGALVHDLRGMLTGMRQRLRQAPLDPAVAADIDLYLAVPASLLYGTIAEPVAGADPARIEQLVEAARAAAGMEEVELFGRQRLIDTSQFTPRGHYAESQQLSRYFQAMMWLGRIDLRLSEADAAGTVTPNRPQIEAALAIEDLMGEAERVAHRRIDTVVEAFVGPQDSMGLSGLTGLRGALQGDLAGLADADLLALLEAHGFGLQRIASHLTHGRDGGEDEARPLAQSFLILGQRYTFDSHVFSNLVYDRLPTRRMMPDPLDVGFAALNNDQAGMLLSDELNEWGYAPQLHAMRVLADSHGQDYWQSNLYTLWLSAIRSLSPDNEALTDRDNGLPSVARSEAWGRRLLNTQMASWAELRHDTLLYAKQSYTAMASCEFPAAYVEPYPEFYAELGRFAEVGSASIAELDFSRFPGLGGQIGEWFGTLGEAAEMLGAMAQAQRDGEPHTRAQLRWINQAIRRKEEPMGCAMGVTDVDGWYAELFFNPVESLEFDPTIADVHTQPTTADGAVVGRVLHVATGRPRLMVVTVDTCEGPAAYAGLASSYYEVTTENWDRLDDQTWAGQLYSGTPANPWWMEDLID